MPASQVYVSAAQAVQLFFQGASECFAVTERCSLFFANLFDPDEIRSIAVSNDHAECFASSEQLGKRWMQGSDRSWEASLSLNRL